jgi:hypothetical protein
MKDRRVETLYGTQCKDAKTIKSRWAFVRIHRDTTQLQSDLAMWWHACAREWLRALHQQAHMHNVYCMLLPRTCVIMGVGEVSVCVCVGVCIHTCMHLCESGRLAMGACTCLL